jgi:chaperonin GroES
MEVDKLPSPEFEPALDYMIVLPDEAESKTASGIIIPDTAKEKPKKGTVLLTGPGLADAPMLAKRGDKILYGTYTGVDVEINGEKFVLMKNTDIYGFFSRA